MSAIVAEAQRLGIARLFTEASITARPFFESQGFVVLTEQAVTLAALTSSTTGWKRRQQQAS